MSAGQLIDAFNINQQNKNLILKPIYCKTGNFYSHYRQLLYSYVVIFVCIENSSKLQITNPH